VPSTALTLPLSTPLQPPLKWAGGKRWLVPHLRQLWRPFSAERFVEPFAGAAGISLGLAPTRALLNDNNPHVINFFNWLKRGLVIKQQGLENEIAKNGETAGNPTNGAADPGGFQARLWMQNDRELYYAHRKRFNELLAGEGAQTVEAAALFYYLNRTGFNGLCRFNRRGQFNVPFGRYQNINYTRDFSPYQRLMADWQFTSMDFEKVPPRKFPCLRLARRALEEGGAQPCALNAADEVAVEAFLGQRLGFLQIAQLVAETLELAEAKGLLGEANDLDGVLAADASARRLALNVLRRERLPPVH